MTKMTSVYTFQMFLVIRASYQGKELQEKNHVVRVWVVGIAQLKFLVDV